MHRFWVLLEDFRQGKLPFLAEDEVTARLIWAEQTEQCHTLYGCHNLPEHASRDYVEALEPLPWRVQHEVCGYHPQTKWRFHT